MLGPGLFIKENYVAKGKVKLVVAPVLNHGEQSLLAHQGAECAAEQGKFWEFREFLFQNQPLLEEGDIRGLLEQLAVEMELDSTRFNDCINQQRYLNLVQEQDRLRRERGIPFQPTFDINGELLVGPQTQDVFQRVIEAELAK